MGCCGKICALIFAISTLITAITALGFTGYFTKPHCSVTGSSADCGESVTEFCKEHGAYSHSTVTISSSVSASTVECPWRSATYVIAIMALVVVFILVLLIVVAACKNISLKCSIILVGLAALILLLIGSGLMVKDLIDAVKYYADTFKNGNLFVFQPVKYAINIAMMVATIFSTITSICCGVSLSKTNSSLVSPFKSGANSSRNSNFHSVANTSNVMTNGNNTTMGYNNGHNTSMGYNSGYNNQPMRGGYNQNQMQMQPQYPQRR